MRLSDTAAFYFIDSICLYIYGSWSFYNYVKYLLQCLCLPYLSLSLCVYVKSLWPTWRLNTDWRSLLKEIGMNKETVRTSALHLYCFKHKVIRAWYINIERSTDCLTKIQFLITSSVDKFCDVGYSPPLTTDNFKTAVLTDCLLYTSRCV